MLVAKMCKDTWCRASPAVGYVISLNILPNLNIVVSFPGSDNPEFDGVNSAIVSWRVTSLGDGPVRGGKLEAWGELLELSAGLRRCVERYSG